LGRPVVHARCCSPPDPVAPKPGIPRTSRPHCCRWDRHSYRKGAHAAALDTRVSDGGLIRLE